MTESMEGGGLARHRLYHHTYGERRLVCGGLVWRGVSVWEISVWGLVCGGLVWRGVSVWGYSIV